MPLSPTVPADILARGDLADWLSNLGSNPSYVSLQALADYVVANRDFRTVISYTVTKLLEPALIPSTEYHPSHGSVLAAMGAIAVISSQANVVLSLGASREEMSVLFRDHYVRFLEWLQFFSNKGIFVIPSAAFILSILDMDEGLRHAFMDSPSAIDLVFDMWMQQDEFGQYHIPTNGEMACPLLLLIWRIIGNPRGSSTFYARLQFSPSDIRGIADTLQGRLRALRNGHSKGNFTPSFTLGQLRGMSKVVEGLLYQPDHHKALFHSHQLLYEISFTLSVCLSEERSSILWIYASDVLASLYTYILKSSPRSGSTLAKVISAVDGRLIDVLLRALLYVPAFHRNHQFTANFLRDIVGYIAYRSVARRLVASINSENSIAMAGVREPSPLFSQCWEEVLYASQAHNEVDGPKIASSMCDSVQHFSTPAQQREKSKRCSGCQARSYCSSKCQKDDWDARHRHECGRMRLTMAAELNSGVDLRLNVRADLAAFVERMGNAHIRAFRSCARRALAAPLASLIMRVNGISVPAMGGLSTVAEFFASVKASFGDHIPQRLRINDYVTQMLREPEIHLAYAVFPLGLLTVHLLVRMRNDGDDVFGVVSVMTIGISECATNPKHIWSAQLGHQIGDKPLISGGMAQERTMALLAGHEHEEQGVGQNRSAFLKFTAKVTKMDRSTGA